MPIVGVFATDLTRLGRQQILQGPKDKLDPRAPPPPPDQLRGTQPGFHTQQIEAVLARLIYDDDSHLAIGGTRGPQSYIAYPDLPRILPPPPPLALDQVPPFDLLPISQGKSIGLFTLYEQGAVMR